MLLSTLLRDKIRRAKSRPSTASYDFNFRRRFSHVSGVTMLSGSIGCGAARKDKKCAYRGLVGRVCLIVG